ncbi:transposase domain-containing protein [Kitasatospora sp. NPDC059571]|uniref:transposase domain-containing protein n=1 Tax=Kitasatospora sp. NPDC059571 TaxID=3346871 RepID=UPI003693D181
MPRAGQRKSAADGYLAQAVALGVLARAFPPEHVQEVVSVCGRAERRRRLLPADTVLYFILAMCLFWQLGYEDVARLLPQLPRRDRCTSQDWKVPTTAAIGRARQRLGADPLRELLHRFCRPERPERHSAARFRSWHVATVEVVPFDLPPSQANIRHFAPEPADDGASGPYPQAKVAALTEYGDDGVFGVEVGPSAAPEHSLAAKLLPLLSAGMLLMAGQRLFDLDCWYTARAAGADVVWQIGEDVPLPVAALLDDGSYLSELPRPAGGGRGERVRVVGYSAGDPTVTHRLVTSIADPLQAPAGDLAALHARGREADGVLDVIRVRHGGPRLVLRSRDPGGVEQEVLGLFTVHHALREFLAPTRRHPKSPVHARANGGSEHGRTGVSLPRR